MPDTPVYAITYPCEGSAITLADFAALANDVDTAVAATDADAVAVTHLATGRAFGQANPAFNVEATLTYLGIPAQNTTNGITLNAATGVFTVVTAGVYSASIRNAGVDSTLTITSQRMSVAVNGVNQVTRKYRGSNPPDPTSLTGSFTCDIFCAVGDLVTFRFLWTGTGALLNPAQAIIALDLLATP